MSEDQKIIDLLISRQDAQDRMIVSINDNLAGIRNVLEKLELHDYRLDEHRRALDNHEKRIDDIESGVDKNQTVMDILNRILRVGIPALIAAIMMMGAIFWYGINKPSTTDLSSLDAILSRYLEKKP